LRKATTLVICATAALAFGCALLLHTLEPAFSQAELSAAVAFALFSLFGALLPYNLSDRVVGSATFVTLLAGVVLVPSWISVASACCVTALAQIFQRSEPRKLVFNVAQHALAISCSIAAYRLTGHKGIVSGAEATAGSLLAAFLGFFLANSAAVACVVAADTQQRLATVWKQNSLKGLALDVLALPFVYVFVKLYTELGVLATSAAVALVLIVRQLNSTNIELQRSNEELLELTVTTLEARDPYTSGHSRRVSQYSRLIGVSLGLPAKDIERLAVASLLHDVGKIHEAFAPILSKPGKLTPEERAIMESHPIKGAELVRISSHLRHTVEPIRHHHEAWDGSGYPDAIAGSEIPLFSRIIAVADTIDAMASDRPYRRGLSSERIRSELVRMQGIQFDPEMLGKLLVSGTIDEILALASPASEIVEEKSVMPAMALG
jgi:HD-GYP domain-containing protein (c-di-GMP phosphodiesterase class II)